MVQRTITHRRATCPRAATLGAGVFPTSEAARVGALNMCSESARAALTNYATDVRLKQMVGDPCPIGVEAGGFDDVEFDHWMRVAQVRRTELHVDDIIRSYCINSASSTGISHTLLYTHDPRHTPSPLCPVRESSN
jgi:hypothetical protein